MFKCSRILLTNAEKSLSQDKKALILSVLRSTATKREAKQYISKYTPRVLDRPSSAIFEKDDHSRYMLGLEHHIVRTAIIKIRDIKSYQPEVLAGLGDTINRLCQLGLAPVIVVDAGKDRSDILNLDDKPFRHYQKAISWKINLIARIIESCNGKARPMEGIYDVQKNKDGSDTLKITLPGSLKSPIKNGIIPIVSPTAWDATQGRERLVTADDIVYAVARDLTNETQAITARLKDTSDIASIKMPQFTIDKVIFIEPLGGIPSVERGRGASHVYINLEQELQEISAELHIGFLDPSVRDIHLDNLNAMNKVLSILPISSAGLITTPTVAAAAVSKNPIIYNLITDRPVISPSLPVTQKRTPILETTILRKGMKVKILFSTEGLDLVKEDKAGTIELDKLVKLINSSFKKELDVDSYLKRVNKRVAGIVIAGDYQGAAVITWETPKSVPGIINFQQLMQGKPTATNHRIAYLDKFAVEPQAQGGAGIADIVFKGMVMRLFPEEILWRSRKTNPVNKWYFERSKGTIKIPGTPWALFYTGSNTRERTNLNDYIDVCQRIEPSFKESI